MNIESMKRKIEKETGKFIKVQTYNGGGQAFEGYATIGDEVKTYGRTRIVKGNIESFEVYGQNSAHFARIAVVEKVAKEYGITFEISAVEAEENAKAVEWKARMGR
jgi:hypothetical protein